MCELCWNREDMIFRWDCPKCGGENMDNVGLTAEPFCEHCEESFDWSEVSREAIEHHNTHHNKDGELAA